MCTTGSVGQPQGRLKWVKVADGSQISVGGYGSTTLQMTQQTLTLNDHDVKFRCDVDWVEDVTGQTSEPALDVSDLELHQENPFRHFL